MQLLPLRARMVGGLPSVTADVQSNGLTQVPRVRHAKNLEAYYLNSNKITMIRQGERRAQVRRSVQQLSSPSNACAVWSIANGGMAAQHIKY